MPIKILMPALSPTMTEGTLARWLKREGDTVASGDVIAEIETDKATMEVEAVDEGRLGRILVPEGTEGVPVNQPIALLLQEGEDTGALDQPEAGAPAPRQNGGGASSQNGHAEPAPETMAHGGEPPSGPPEAARRSETALTGPPGGAPTGATAPGSGAPSRQAGPAAGAAPAAPPATGQRIAASPLARRMAKMAGIDLGALRGSGPNGRVVKVDVEAALSGARAAPAAAPVPAAAPPPPAPTAPQAAPAPAAARAPAGAIDARRLAEAYGLPFREVKNSNVRKVIARRLTEAKQTVPHFYLTADCELDELLKLRKQLNERSKLSLSVNDLIIKIAALALRQVPQANAAWTEDAILIFDRVDVSVAVATEGGLITPIIKAADQKGLAQISAEMKDLAARAREGKLKPEEFQGGTFSLSNLGMYGVREFAAIINPPQGCILAVGRGEQRPVVKDGALAIATVMSATLSVDHRVVDGAVGAEYLAAFKKLTEDPLAMLL